MVAAAGRARASAAMIAALTTKAGLMVWWNTHFEFPVRAVQIPVPDRKSDNLISTHASEGAPASRL
jgi:hypothetical protein